MLLLKLSYLRYKCKLSQEYDGREKKLAKMAELSYVNICTSGYAMYMKYFLSNFFDIILIVMAMESQAEALGQLTSDDLEGKVL